MYTVGDIDLSTVVYNIKNIFPASSMVELRSVKPVVAGSSPALGANHTTWTRGVPR